MTLSTFLLGSQEELDTELDSLFQVQVAFPLVLRYLHMITLDPRCTLNSDIH